MTIFYLTIFQFVAVTSYFIVLLILRIGAGHRKLLRGRLLPLLELLANPRQLDQKLTPPLPSGPQWREAPKYLKESHLGAL